jgi:hypothetical protein
MIYIVVIIVAVISIKTIVYIISISKNWIWIPCIIITWIIIPRPARIIGTII